jgi:hypothetical protein
MNLVRDFPIIIVSLITFFYFSIGILLANKSKLDLKIFALLGYATSVLVIVILFYSPLKQFLTKAANETTNREIFEVP